MEEVPNPGGAARPRDRLFDLVTAISTQRPGTALAIAAVIVLGTGSLVPGIGFTTSRHGLVADDNPYQARLLHFFDRFGYPDQPIMVVHGGTPEQRREVVDELLARFEKDKDLTGRSLAKLGPKQIAEVVLLMHPELLTRLGSSLPENTDLPTMLEGGLGSMSLAMRNQAHRLSAALQMQAFSPLPSAGFERYNAGLRRFTAIATAFESAIDGSDIWAELTASAAGGSQWSGVDSHGYLVGRSGEFHLMALFPNLTGDEVEQFRPVIERIRLQRDEVMADHPGVEALLTGVPSIIVDERKVIEAGMWQSSIATTVGILLLFLLAFRSVRLTLVAGVPLIVGVVVTLGIVRVLYGELNLVTSSFISVVLGLGIDFGVHLLARFNELRRAGDEPLAAIVGAVRRAGPGILTGAVTTALAFLTITTTEFTAFAEMGVITSIGLVLILGATLLIVPPLLSKTAAKVKALPPELPGLHRLPTAIRGMPKVVLAASVIGAVAGAIALPGIAFNTRYWDFLPKETESARGLMKLEEDGAMTPAFASLSAPGIEAARGMAERLRQLPTVASVQTATDLLPPLDEVLDELRTAFEDVERDPDFEHTEQKPQSATEISAMLDDTIVALQNMKMSMQLTARDTKDVDEAIAAYERLRDKMRTLPNDGTTELGRLSTQLTPVIERAWTTARQVAERGTYAPEDLPELFQLRFISRDAKEVALYVFPTGNIWDKEVADRFRRDLERLDPDASGFAITVHQHSMMILEGFQRAAAFAAFLVFLVLLIDFRNLRDALLAMLPVAFGWVWMLGVMSAFELTFDVANIVVLPLVFGIGIDAGVHLVHRYRESANENGGTARLDELLKGTGAAVMLASVTTMVGFAGLMVADYGAMKSLGMLMVLGIGCCLIACLFVLPAMLVLLKRAE